MKFILILYPINSLNYTIKINKRCYISKFLWCIISFVFSRVCCIDYSSIANNFRVYYFSDEFHWPHGTEKVRYWYYVWISPEQIFSNSDCRNADTFGADF